MHHHPSNRVSHVATAALCLAAALAASPAAAIDLAATDAGFVTAMGGSAKGDGTVVTAATYNYSVGFEVHYGDGALGSPLAPMPRKNYFVFDLSGVTTPIAGATLKLWTGTLESIDPAEAFALHAPGDMATSLVLAADLAAGSTTGEFDEADDALVAKAKDLYGLLAAGPALAEPFVVTSDLDDSFIELVFTPAGLAFIEGLAGGSLLVAGFVPTIDGDPPASPQQPFGFTSPDIPGGGPLTPMLVLTAVPEPAPAWLMLGGALALAGMRRARRDRSETVA